MPKATPALEITTTEAPPKRTRGNKPIATEKHTVVTEWEEKKKIVPPVPAKARKAAPVAEEFEEDDEPEETEMPDSAHALFEEYGFDEGLMMDINRLPDYTLNRRTDPVSWQWVTMMPFTPLFKQEIALRHARQGEANWFLIVLKDQNGRIIRREDGKGRIGPFSVEAASNEERIANGLPPHPPQANVTVTTNQATAVPYPMQPVIPQQSVTERIAEVAQIFSVFKDMGLIPKAQPNPQPVEQFQQPRLSEEDIIVKAAMSSPDAQERVAKGIFSKLIGGAMTPDETPWYADLIKDFALSLAPGFNALMQAGAHKMVQAQTFVAQQQQQQQAPSLPEGVQGQQSPANFQPEPSTQQSAPSPEPQQQAAPQSAYEVIFRTLINQRKLPSPLNAPHRAVNALWGAHEYYGRLVPPGAPNPLDDAIDAFLDVTPEEVINLAKVFAPDESATIEQPDAAKWLKSVQDEIRKEWAQDGNEEAQP